MRIWLELTQEEGEKLFEAVKGFSVDRMQTAVVGAPAEKAEKKSKQDSGKAVKNEKTEKIEKPEDEPKVTKEMIRAVLIEKKLQDKVLKDLFAKYGASNLSGVKEEDYPAFIKDAEAL